jgi:hypothetical protein
MTSQYPLQSQKLTCEPFRGTLEEWDAQLALYPDREIFQSSAWMRFVAEAQQGEPILLLLKEGDQTVGCFAGLIVKKACLKILGSPFVGWGTERMGIRLLPGASRRAAIEAVSQYAFKRLKCIHFEMTDWQISPEEIDGLGFNDRIYRSSVVNLTPPEDKIYSQMSSKSCRYSIRKAEKLGVFIEEARDESFADDYHAQLCDVFAKQSLVPTYGKARVQMLIRHLMPTGNLLLLRAREPQGRCIATGIFFGMNEYAYFWGNASWRQDQHFCPNETIHWYAIRYWKQKGMRYYDFCGGGLYKRKYGGQAVESHRISKSKYPWIRWSRYGAEKGYHLYRRFTQFYINQHPIESSDDD